MDGEPGSLEEPPLIGGNLSFGEMGITPPLEDIVMDVYRVMFDQHKKRIMQERHRM